MKTPLQEIQEKVQYLHPVQVEELIRWLEDFAPGYRKDWFEKLEAWTKVAFGCVKTDQTTDQIMQLTRGED